MSLNIANRPTSLSAWGLAFALLALGGCGDQGTEDNREQLLFAPNDDRTLAPTMTDANTPTVDGTGVMSGVGMAQAPTDNESMSPPINGERPSTGGSEPMSSSPPNENTSGEIGSGSGGMPSTAMEDCSNRFPDGTVAATLRILNPGLFGAGYSGVNVTSECGTSQTDANGLATVDISQGAYAIGLTVGGARKHTVYGVSGPTPFTQITYMSPDFITSSVFGQLNILDDPAKGIVVIGLDTPSLAPAVGASATISGDSGEPFTFVGNSPTLTNTIAPNGQGFLTFPNVTPGQIRVETSFPNGSCSVFPSEDGEVDVTVAAGEVSVIAYTCRPN